MKISFSATLVLAALAQATSARADRDVSEEARPAGLSALVQGNNDFAFDLYARLREEPGNLFFSPASISTALGMTYAGARGETARQMATTLHFPLQPSQLPRTFGGLIRTLNGSGRNRPYRLHLANSLWRQQDVPFRSSFLRLAKTSFSAEVHPVDFKRGSGPARRRINAWVRKKTQGKIKEIFEAGSPSPRNRLLLINAVYFKSKWEALFEKQATRKGVFRLTAQKKRTNVPMMHQNVEHRYRDGGTFQLLEMKYLNAHLQMVILLPRQVDGLADLEKELTAARVAKALQQARTHEVNVTLPKFTITAEVSLQDTLSALGMPLAFSSRADFSGMLTRDPLALSAVIHKAYVAVNEEGTEAAGITRVDVDDAADVEARRKPRATFRADHPFFFLIRHAETGSILFMGRVTNPKG